MLVLAGLTWLALGQPNVQGAGGQPPPPLHDTMLSMFDTDNDGGVSVAEITATLDGFEKMSAMGMGGPPNAAPGAENPMAATIRAAKRFAPMLHKLIDADGSGKLSKEELKWVAKTQGIIKKPGVLKHLVEGVFAKIDTDADEILSEVELRAAIEGETLEEILSMIQEQLPIPSLSTAASLSHDSRDLLKKHFQEGLAYLDTNGDGAVERKEMFGAVKGFKKMFMQGVTTVETMGPMLTMFKAFQPPGQSSNTGPQAKRRRGPPTHGEL